VCSQAVRRGDRTELPVRRRFLRQRRIPSRRVRPGIRSPSPKRAPCSRSSLLLNNKSATIFHKKHDLRCVIEVRHRGRIEILIVPRQLGFRFEISRCRRALCDSAADRDDRLMSRRLSRPFSTRSTQMPSLDVMRESYATIPPRTATVVMGGLLKVYARNFPSCNVTSVRLPDAYCTMADVAQPEGPRL
jgi:hypothetical protein